MTSGDGMLDCKAQPGPAAPSIHGALADNAVKRGFAAAERLLGHRMSVFALSLSLVLALAGRRYLSIPRGV